MDKAEQNMIIRTLEFQVSFFVDKCHLNDKNGRMRNDLVYYIYNHISVWNIVHFLNNKKNSNELVTSIIDKFCLLALYVISTKLTKRLIPQLTVTLLMDIYIVLREKYCSPLSKTQKIILLSITNFLLIFLCWKWIYELT